MGNETHVAPQVTVVIPAYNEADRIEPTLREIDGYCAQRGLSWEVLVVDDGSHDRTATVVGALSRDLRAVRLLRLPANFGKGFAVRTGVINARGEQVLFADADGATPIAEIERLQRELEAGADIAIGSRVGRHEGVRVKARLHRRLAGRIFHQLVRALTVRGFRDTQCGFKLFRAEVAQDLFARMRMNGFSFDVELLLMATRRGYTVREVLVNWTHQPGSRINLVTDSIRMALDLFVIRSHLVSGQYDRPGVPSMERVRAGEPAPRVERVEPVGATEPVSLG